MLEETHSLNQKNETVLTLLGIRGGEGLAVGLLFGQSFLLGITLFALYTAGNTIFLSHFDSNAIAYVYVVSACLLILIGVFFKRLEQQIPFALLLLGSAGGLLVTLLFLRLGLWAIPGKSVAFLLLVTLRIAWTLMNLVLWALAGRLFDLNQSKRLYPLIVVGTVLAIIMGGLFNQPLIRLVGIPNLLWISIAGLAGVSGLLSITLRIFSAYTGRPQPKRHAEQRTLDRDQNRTTRLLTGSGSLWRNRYILWMITFSMLSTLATYLLEFIFVSEAAAYFGDASEYARFFGAYLGVATLILLVVSLFSGPIFERLGLKIGLQINATAVTLFALLFLVYGLLTGGTPILFWIVVATKLSDDVLVVAMNNTAQRILYQTLPADQQVSVQTMIESIVVPVAIGVIGLFLIALQFAGSFSTYQLILLLVGLCLGWLVASIKTHNSYLRTLHK